MRRPRRPRPGRGSIPHPRPSPVGDRSRRTRCRGGIRYHPAGAHHHVVRRGDEKREANATVHPASLGGRHRRHQDGSLRWSQAIRSLKAAASSHRRREDRAPRWTPSPKRPAIGVADFETAAVAVTGAVKGGRWSSLNPGVLAIPRDFPLVEELSHRLGVNVIAMNDAQAAAWGEFRLGAGKDRDMVFLTISTGIGGGIVMGGRLITGRDRTEWAYRANVDRDRQRL